MVKCGSMEDLTVVAYGCRKTKNLKCGMEGENVVDYGRLSSPAHQTFNNFLMYLMSFKLKTIFKSSLKSHVYWDVFKRLQTNHKHLLFPTLLILYVEL